MRGSPIPSMHLDGVSREAVGVPSVLRWPQHRTQTLSCRIPGTTLGFPSV